MKKTIYKISLILIMIFLLASTTNAKLINHPTGDLIFDDYTGLVWYKGVKQFGEQSYLEQLESISSLNRAYDINQDGYVDKLTWRMADITTVNELILNYSLNEESSVVDFIQSYYFSETYDYWTDDCHNFLGVTGHIQNETDDSYGFFSINLSSVYATWSGPGYNPHSGSIELVEIYDEIPLPPDPNQDPGEIFIDPPDIEYPYDPGYYGYYSDFGTGAWVTATVEYAHPTPVPSTISLLGIGLLGFAGIYRKKKYQQ